MEQLVIAWEPGSETCDWMLLDQNGNRQGAINRGTVLEGLPRDKAVRTVLWMVPGSRAPAITARIPARGREKILRALPFALEESFAADPEALFFALAPETRDPVQHAVAVEHRWLAEGLETLQGHGLRPQHIVPDYLLLPRGSDEWTVLSDDGMLYVRQGRASGFAIENSIGWQVLRERLEALAEEDKPQVLRYIRGRDPLGPEPGLEGLQAESEPQPEGLMGLVPQGLAEPLGIDLRQGRFTLSKEWMPKLRPWLPVAAALALVALVGLSIFGAGWFQATQARTALSHQIRTRFEQLMPHVRWQGDSYARDIIESQLRSHGGAQSEGTFLNLLADVATVIRDNAAIKIESLTYQNGQLELHVHAPTGSDLDDLRGKLVKVGANTNIRSRSQTSSGIEGSLMIQAGGGGS